MPRQYDPKFIQACLERVLPPDGECIRTVAKDIGVAASTVHRWIRQAKANGTTFVEGGNKQWSSNDKFQAVLDTAHLNEAELSEYCRRNGLYAEQLEAWRNACQTANGGVSEETSELKQQVRSLQKQSAADKKELARKEAALAETAALLVLRKKAQAIWGDPEDE